MFAGCLYPTCSIINHSTRTLERQTFLDLPRSYQSLPGPWTPETFQRPGRKSQNNTQGSSVIRTVSYGVRGVYAIHLELRTSITALRLLSLRVLLAFPDRARREPPRKQMSAPRDACRHELWPKHLPTKLTSRTLSCSSI